jgi:hypothetical protein
VSTSKDISHVEPKTLARASCNQEQDYFFLVDFPFFAGTFAPARLASDRPMAIACFLLVTFLPLRPLRIVPFLRSCITFLTLSLAFLLYFRGILISSEMM